MGLANDNRYITDLSKGNTDFFLINILPIQSQTLGTRESILVLRFDFLQNNSIFNGLHS